MGRALLVVDVQRDFCEGGSLGVTGGGRVAAAVSDLIADSGYDLVVATRDWHIDPGRHFAPESEVPDFVDTWPVHCIAGSDGAAWHPALHLPADAVVVSKGQHSAAFSGFDGETETGERLADLLRRRSIDSVDVVGIATSFCVAETAMDALAAGFATRVLADLTADVDSAATEATLGSLAGAGVEVSGSQ